MPGGTPVSKNWVLVLLNGSVVIDWGDGIFQDVYSGDFLRCTETQISHTIQEEELEWLKRAGKIIDFDQQMVYFYPLPERSRRMLD